LHRKITVKQAFGLTPGEKKGLWPSSPFLKNAIKIVVDKLSLGAHACSRIFVTVDNVCALVNGRQNILYLYECWMVTLFFFCCGRTGGCYSHFERSPYFCGAVKIRTNRFRSQEGKTVHKGVQSPPHRFCPLLVVS